MFSITSLFYLAVILLSFRDMDSKASMTCENSYFQTLSGFGKCFLLLPSDSMFRQILDETIDFIKNNF